METISYLRENLNLPDTAMNKTQLIDAIAVRAGVPKTIAKKNLDAFLDVTADTLRMGNKITISGFGSFEVTRKPARVGRNFLTGTPVEIPPKSMVKFRCSALDDMLDATR